MVSHSFAWASAYLLAYLVLRLTMAWIIGVWGLGDPVVRSKIWLVPVRDSVNFLVWVAGFFFSTVQWRGKAYRVNGSYLIPLAAKSVANPGLNGATSPSLVSARRY
jgi:hypothetical protein